MRPLVRGTGGRVMLEDDGVAVVDLAATDREAGRG